MASEGNRAGYEGLYAGFDSPLMREVRREAYGEDVGQHSWVTAEDLRRDQVRLGLSEKSNLLDLGCGPGGPLAYLAGQARCRGTGLDSSSAAIEAARARAAAQGLEGMLDLRVADLNGPLPFGDAMFSAATSLDVILHLRDREGTFREVARVLVPGGAFLFTDAGVVTGPVSSEEIRLRAANGYTQFAPPGFNERALEHAGLELMETEDRSAGLLRNASGRLSARRSHRHELEALEGSRHFEEQQEYLEVVAALTRKGSLSRWMYLGRRARR